VTIGVAVARTAQRPPAGSLRSRVMADWETISALATGGGTLILAVATFASVRSSNRTARIAERSLLVGLRPLLLASRSDALPQKIVFGDGHTARVGAERAVVEDLDGVIYCTISIRNVATGLAVLHGWHVVTTTGPMTAERRTDLDAFQAQTRDLFIAGGDTSFWQGAVRNPEDPAMGHLRAQLAANEPVTIDLLYGDQEGGQRTITRFVLRPLSQRDELSSTHQGTVVRHWNVDSPDPRH
jgi:hypothetical protein